MACPSFEELMRADKPQVAEHAAHCEECRALLEAAAEVEATLESAFRGISAPPGLAARVRRQVSREKPLRRPSWTPEVLDFIGWAAVLALIAVLIPRYLPAIQAMLARLG